MFGGLVGFDLVRFDLGSPEAAGLFVLDLVNLNLLIFDLIGPEAAFSGLAKHDLVNLNLINFGLVNEELAWPILDICGSLSRK